MAKILIVDDDQGTLEVLGDYLNVFNFETDLAESVAKARNCLARSNYDAVLSDFSMPGETGLDLLIYVSSLCPKLPFILMTGQHSDRLKQEAMAMGSSAYMEKPFNLQDLIEILGIVLRPEDCRKDCFNDGPTVT
ncbi:MAG: response regulator [Syntrophobacteraceae bacterium]